MSNRIKKCAIACSTALLSLIQTGCIVGNCQQDPTNAVCTTLGAAGTAMGGVAGIVTTALLDENNPGRVDALNTLPVDGSVAAGLGAELDDLATYNDELGGIMDTNAVLEQELKRYQQGKTTSAELDSVAKQTGFDDGQELVTVLQKRVLASDKIQRFADARGVSFQTARIYLMKRWSIRAE